MIRTIFEWLSYSFAISALIAVLLLLFGTLSILLSPCHLSSIPLIVGFIDGQGKVSVKRAFFFSYFIFSGYFNNNCCHWYNHRFNGKNVSDIGSYGNYIVAIILIIVGLYFLEIINIPLSFHFGFKKKGLFASFILGLIFGGAIACTFAYMMPMLGVVFKVASTNFVYAVSLILFYAIGHCLVIVFAGIFTGVVQQYLNWNENQKGAVILKKYVVFLLSSEVFI